MMTLKSHADVHLSSSGFPFWIRCQLRMRHQSSEAMTRASSALLPCRYFCSVSMAFLACSSPMGFRSVSPLAVSFCMVVCICSVCIVRFLLP